MAEDLRESLMADLTKTTQGAEKTARGLGVQFGEGQKIPLQAKGMLIAREPELNQQLRATQQRRNDLVKDLAKNAGFSDALVTQQFESQLGQKVNLMEQQIMRSAQEFERAMEQAALDQKQKEETMGFFEGLLGGFGKIIGGLF